MYLIGIILLIILLIIMLLVSLIPIKIYLNANSTDFPNFNIIFSWFYPFFEGRIYINENSIVTLDIYLFKKLFKSKPLTIKKHSNGNLYDSIKNFKLKSIDFETHYGFSDPSITGFICGIINILPINALKNNILNYPDFTTDTTYFNTTGVIEINMFFLLVQLMKSKFHTSSKNVSYANK
ncbi:hypothetical protein [Clostridium novyi]|uniref:Membrane associated protein n=1 Tax=Clostridium novyi (strain NT) TaxID=386415 RepID=A0PZU8_CLONN|nr:hypothetical protein [Clostridium novyi]ABK60520.1 membrane associated protein [Clostridium novyi NT]KEH88398.1 membrane protein [Clostridium novyi A str. NCTC 538]